MPTETIETSIDLSKIFKILLRNKKVISYFIFGSFIVSVFYSLTAKKVWQGELQIVLESSKNEGTLSRALSSIRNRNINLSALSNISNKSSLKTEVGILESPSVLMSVFEYVKDKKGLNSKKAKLTFANWKKNSLDILLKRNTSILNLSYQDSEKELIIPVLSKISQKYQAYSGEKRSRELALGEEFFQEQISEYKLIANKSMKEAQEYALDQDLSISFGIMEKKDQEMPNNFKLEQVRVMAANELKSINYRLEQLSKSDLDVKSLVTLAKSIPQLTKKTFPQDLLNIESQLSIAKAIYKDNDKTIVDLQKTQKVYSEILKNQIKSYLDAQKISATAKLKAAERPKDVVLKYGQLLTKAARDKFTLDNLENNYRLVQLEKARRKDPWQLIAEPTLLPEPVKPKKLNVIGIGTLLGFIAGSIFVLYRDKKKKIIFETSEINDYLLEKSLIKELSIKKPNIISETLSFISKNYLNETEDKFEILLLGDIDNKYKNELKKVMKSSQLFNDKILSTNLEQISDNSKIILLIGLGLTNGYELKENLNRIYLRNQDIIIILSMADLTKENQK